MENVQKEKSKHSIETTTKPLIFFAVTTFVLGQLVGFISLKVFPFDISNLNYDLPAIYPPYWVFPLVWCFLYPCMGLSIGYIWLLKKQFDIKGILICYVIMLTSNLLFVPIMNLSKGNPAIMTLMDINGVISASLFSWLCFKYSMKAFYWSLPLTIWMPITVIIKITLWVTNTF